MEQEEYRCKQHEERIRSLENHMSGILTAQAVTNEKLNYISAQLENGIKTKLEILSKNMDKILPIIEQDLRKDSATKVAVEIAIKTGIVGLMVSAFGAFFLFLVKMFFEKNG